MKSCVASPSGPCVLVFGVAVVIIFPHYCFFLPMLIVCLLLWDDQKCFPHDAQVREGDQQNGEGLSSLFLFVVRFFEGIETVFKPVGLLRILNGPVRNHSDLLGLNFIHDFRMIWRRLVKKRTSCGD